MDPGVLSALTVLMVFAGLAAIGIITCGVGKMMSDGVLQKMFLYWFCGGRREQKNRERDKKRMEATKDRKGKYTKEQVRMELFGFTLRLNELMATESDLSIVHRATIGNIKDKVDYFDRKSRRKIFNSVTRGDIEEIKQRLNLLEERGKINPIANKEKGVRDDNQWERVGNPAKIQA